MRLVTNDERRARLGMRHALTVSTGLRTPEEVARALVGLHATESASVHLSIWARSREISISDVQRSLYHSRTLITQLSMRETLFAYPRDLIPAVLGSAAARVAGVARRRLIRDLERWGSTGEGEGQAWLTAAETTVLSGLADGVPRSSKQIRTEIAEVSGVINQAPDKSWGGPVAIAPKVLALLNLQGSLARAGNAGDWYRNHPTWTTTRAWWGQEPPGPLTARQGYAELVHRWLWSYGPGTVEDMAWWLGTTKTAIRTALEDVDARQVVLEDGSVGWLRSDDLDVITAAEDWVALLPMFDPTVMGWKKRDFYLGEHAPQLFDSAGNSGTTAWVNGRVVGVWIQDAGGQVQVRLLEEVSAASGEALLAEAERLNQLLEGKRVFTVYPSPAMQPEAELRILSPDLSAESCGKRSQ